jgi:hypothetical protein
MVRVDHDAGFRFIRSLTGAWRMPRKRVRAQLETHLQEQLVPKRLENQRGSSLDARRAALGKSLYLLNGGHCGVAGKGCQEGAMSPT